MQLPLNLATLGELDDGAARAIVDAAIRDAINDLEDRAHQDGKPRKVQIVLTLSLMDNGQVDAKVEACAKMPARRTATTVSKITRQEGKPRLVFQQFAPEDPGQTTIDQFEGRDD